MSFWKDLAGEYKFDNWNKPAILTLNKTLNNPDIETLASFLDMPAERYCEKTDNLKFFVINRSTTQAQVLNDLGKGITFIDSQLKTISTVPEPLIIAILHHLKAKILIVKLMLSQNLLEEEKLCYDISNSFQTSVLNLDQHLESLTSNNTKNTLKEIYIEARDILNNQKIDYETRAKARKIEYKYRFVACSFISITTIMLGLLYIRRYCVPKKKYVAKRVRIN